MGKFNALFNRAMDISGKEGYIAADHCTVRSFMAAVTEMDHI